VPARSAALVLCVLAGCGGSAAHVELSPFHANEHNAIVRAVVDEPLVALSFDDGPHPVYTRRVLAILRRYDATATFFLTGRGALAHPALVRRELAEGHELGSHTLNHVDLRRAPRPEREIASGRRAIERIIARPVTLFRPPWGSFDERVGRAAAEDGQVMVGWDLPLDRYLARDGPAGVERLVAEARPGSIVLAHDTTAPTVDVLPRLLADLRARDMRIVTVGRLLATAGAR
jgi:peptidoglycan/xylan/chitin deacetylase (PgdA/CDA1 family)